MLNLILIQSLNGLQFGVLLFLIAAGLTLVFGVMGVINLAHGALYMMGAYFGVAIYQQTGSFALALLLGLPASFMLGILVEKLILGKLYTRSHLDQVLVTFGLLLALNELVVVIWGPGALLMNVPEFLRGTVRILGVRYPLYRLVIIATGLMVAIVLYLLVTRTRAGMLVRAGASNRMMAAALGVDIERLFMGVFGFGVMLAGLAGIIIAPIVSVQTGMGDNILTLCFVVIVIGGIGSIQGAFVASLLVGLVDTLGRSFLPDLLKVVMSASAATAIGPALSSMLIYILMAGVLFFSPKGLLPMRGS